jgi:hypothetical protein
MKNRSALAPLHAALLAMVLVPAGAAVAQTTFPNDVIVQGSLCTGLDCPPASFGFDTIVLRENNLRIFFDDTSVSAGFPANKWRITINDSASGGASFFSVDDATANRSVFKVTAGAPANSLFVASNGNVGLGTAAPVLDLSISTSDTPAIRLEQTAAGGFTAQTWDIGANEANFFVRDVTGGSRLSFRVRPGAPTSSLDIAASGNVGVGTASPSARLHVAGGGIITSGTFPSTVASTGGFDYLTDGMRLFSMGASGATKGTLQYIAKGADGSSITPFVVSNTGSFGLGTTSPAAQLHTTGSVRLAGVTGCTAGIQSNASGDLSCLVSSRQFKTLAGELSTQVAVANVMALRPQTGSYKDTPDVPEHWLIAEDVAAVDPALAGFNDGKPYTVKTQNVVADLVAVVQQQQRRIDELERRLAARQ